MTEKIDFKQAFAGLNEAQPDGGLPKLNNREDPDVDGLYKVTVLQTEVFTGKQIGLTLKFEVRVDACDNDRFRPGAEAAILISGLDARGFAKDKAFGNAKAFLAAAFTSQYEEKYDPHDETQDWIGIMEMAHKQPYVLRGARLSVQAFLTKASGSGNMFVKMIPKALERTDDVPEPQDSSED